MNLKHFATAGCVAALIVTGAGRAGADADGLVGGIVGGIIGGAIVNEANKNRRTKTVYRSPKPGLSSAQRAQNREVQTSLNYFGFPAGTPDGVLGRRSRAAITQYQVHMGYPATGQLNLYERDFLIGSYHRSIQGGAATSQLLATAQGGTRGLLTIYRDQAAGIATPAAPTTTVVVAPQTVAPAPAAPAAPATVEAAAPAAGGLPSFLGSTASRSLASHCNTVSLLTNTNGGFTTLASMSDPNAVLNEQFCLARTYAIASGEELAGQIQGVSTADIVAQCEGLAPAMKDLVSAVSLKPRGDVLRETSAFALASGMAPPQLAATAKICLSVGYRTDNMDVAIGSALLLTALGEGAYGELLGHHLSQGFGASQRADLSAPWYSDSVAAMEQGRAVFAPGQPERAMLVRTASEAVTGTGTAGTMTAPVQPASTLPSFALSDN